MHTRYTAYDIGPILCALCTLCLFSRNGHVNVVRYLVDEAHCDPHVKNNVGVAPLHSASM